MKYSKNTFEIAKSELSKRRSTAERHAAQVKQEFFRIHPEGQQLLDRIGSAGSRAAIAVLKGGDVREELEKLKCESLTCQEAFNKLLRESGLTADDLNPKFNCKLCSDTGYRDGYMCSCFTNLLKSTAIKELNRTTPLQLSGFDTFSTEYYSALPQSQQKLMESNFLFCKKYAESFSVESPNLIFQGGTGLGKTHLSLAIARVALEKGFGVIYGSVQSFASSIERERFSNDDDSDTSALLSDADLLILDDLGTEFPSPYVASVIYNIVDVRIMRSLPTIINTNLTVEEIQSRYGERLVSRIYGCFNKLTFVGKDIRILKKSKR